MTSASNSNIDIQSWWEVPSIAHFCSLFRVAFNLLDFDIEELEEALLTDGTELNGSCLLQELIVRLLCGCLGHNGISVFNYQMFLRRLFRSKCKEQGRTNPFNTDIDFQFLPLRTKVEILHALCDFRLDADDVIDVLKNLDSDSLRVHPLGHDENKSAYWYFYGTRLYREDYPKRKKRKKSDQKVGGKRSKEPEDDIGSGEDSVDSNDLSGMGEGTWQVMCYAEEDWRRLADSLAGSSSKEERALYQVLSEDFLPEIPRLFEEKERLQRKRLLESQPRRQSRRIEKLKSQKEGSTEGRTEDLCLERDRQKKRQRERAQMRRRREERRLKESFSTEDWSSDGGGVLPTGRQTNNSLASATGEIFIKPPRQKFRNSALFRRTQEDLMTGLYKILDRVKAHSDAWPFREPVDENYAPRYYAVIARPMDLKTMEDKLDNAEYGSLQQFRADFQLIVDNCRQYNGNKNEYTAMALRLQALFDACAERFLDVEHSSDDEKNANRDDLNSLASSLSPVNGPRLSPSSDTGRRQSWSSDSDVDRATSFLTDNEKEEDAESSGSRDDEFVPFGDRRKRRKKKRSKRKRRKKKTDQRVTPGPKVARRKPGRPPRSADEDKISDAISTSSAATIQSHAQRKERSRSRESSSSDRPLKSKLPVSLEDRTIPSERPRPRINYKEQETSGSCSSSPDLFSSSDSDDSYNYVKSRHGGPLKPGGSQPPKKVVKRAGVIKNLEAIEQLEIVTEETLKDINRWLDETPRFSDFSSNSNSPIHTPSFVVEEMTSVENELRRRAQQGHIRPRDRFSNDLHRRKMYKEQLGLKKKREIQRTIDRLQPGKSKGNLLSKENKVEDGAGEVKSGSGDDVGPKISLGKVLESDVLGLGGIMSRKDTDDDLTQDNKLIIEEDDDGVKEDSKTEVSKKEEPEVEEDKKEEENVVPSGKMKATPNLSAWFKAFGAPKLTTTAIAPKKKSDPETLPEVKTSDDSDKKLTAELTVGELPVKRTRKASTGSSVSERSSFSQEPADGNSPRPSLDEPYLSPQQESVIKQQYRHSPINGTIKVGFYQDTCFQRGSSDKSGSPRTPYESPSDLTQRGYDSNPQSPVYGGVPSYPSHLSYYETSNKMSEKLPQTAYPVKKRAYPEVELSPPQTGGRVSFIPTRGAMEHERTFTPTPGRMPGSGSLPSPPPSHLPHHHRGIHHLMDPYAEERRMASSPFYPPPTAPVSPSPSPSSPTMYSHSSLPTNYAMEPSPNSQSYGGRPDGVGTNYQCVRSPVSIQGSDHGSPVPINYSNASGAVDDDEKRRSPSPHRTNDLLISPALYGSGGKIMDVPTSSAASYDMMRSKAQYGAPHYVGGPVQGQDLSKLPLAAAAAYAASVGDFQQRLNYSQMADLMTTSARLNYAASVSELMQGKSPAGGAQPPPSAVYNHHHHVQEYMQGKAAAYDMMQASYNRPIPEIIQVKPNEREVTFGSRGAQPPKIEAKLKKSRKRKNSVAMDTTGGFHQFSDNAGRGAPPTGVPGSAFNFGPLKESYPYFEELARPTPAYYGQPPSPQPTPESSPSSHSGGSQAKPFYLAAASVRPPSSYPPPHPFVPPQYQEYIQRHPMMLHPQSILHHPSGSPYPPPGFLGIHPDAMNRPSWL